MSEGNLPLHQVIAPFVQDPTNYFKFKELRYPIKGSETPYRDRLRELVKANVLDESNAIGRPKKCGPKPKLYKIELDSEAFRYLLSIYPDNLAQEFLNSNYCNKFIEKCGFIEAHRLVQSKLENPYYKKIVSISLLNLTATKEEYRSFSDNLARKVLELKVQSFMPVEEAQDSVELSNYQTSSLAPKLTTEPIEKIELLSSFEPLDAVQFYRDTLNIPLTNAYTELAERSVITSGLASFLMFDNYLSPLTAHPANAS